MELLTGIFQAGFTFWRLGVFRRDDVVFKSHGDSSAWHTVLSMIRVYASSILLGVLPIAVLLGFIRVCYNAKVLPSRRGWGLSANL